jgi:hypothetical protein
MPGEPRYRFNMAIVLLRMGKFDDARIIVQGLGKSADRTMAAQVEQFLQQIDRAQQFNSSADNRMVVVPVPETSGGVGSAETTDVDRPAPVMKGRSDQPSESSVNASRATARVAAPAAGTPVAVNSTHVYSMMGAIAAVNCANAPQALFTLQSAGIVMHLHAADFAKLEIKSAAGNVSAARISCVQFAGKKARISYQLASGKFWDGEIVSVEVQSAP